ncbi:hypothetical protein EST38_g3665 [Candolleomyces aberdarensis]|uniref:Uncharacterized protein n=1 Tax=Candolleomyces aberdarensis TaxID=2316362 RepID=A0A4Q2DTJ2_9AGAR|nr:hypothetical protein EST38_g3665 [Candolleomyces aberdarensis]
MNLKLSLPLSAVFVIVISALASVANAATIPSPDLLPKEVVDGTPGVTPSKGQKVGPPAINAALIWTREDDWV